MIGKNPPGIVFYSSVSNSVNGHDGAHNGQCFKSWKPTGQNINGGFGRKGTHKNRTGDGSFRIGIGQPGMDRRNSGVEHKADHDEVIGKCSAVCRNLYKT